MKAYYNKAHCHAARIKEFCISGDYEMAADVEGGPMWTDLKIHGGWNLIRYEEFPKQRQVMVEYKADGLWLVERYDVGSDELKYSVVEDAVFQQNFFREDMPKLVEGVSAERPRRAG